MIQVPLAEFQRNALRTSLKDETPSDLNDFSDVHLSELIRSRFPKELHYLEDAWMCGTISTSNCYIAHPDFRNYPINKDKCYVHEFLKWRAEIDSDSFPCAAEIKAGIINSYPPLIVREREERKFYILDGQRRIITLLYNGVANVDVHAYTGLRSV